MRSPRARDRRPRARLPIPPAPGRALPDLDLSRIHSEDQHDAETSQEAQVLDDKGDQDTAVPFILLADLVHLRELGKKKKNTRAAVPFLTFKCRTIQSYVYYLTIITTFTIIIFLHYKATTIISINI